MIYDCFIFFNELEVLEIRLNTLYDVVDKFVICESTTTHANKPKPLYYELNKKRFRKFSNKIIHLKVTHSPNTDIPWIIIDHQWSKIAEALKDCRPSDTILLSDVDEIPKPKRIIEWKDRPGKYKAFKQSVSYYYLNCIDYKSKGWRGSRMAKYKDTVRYRLYAGRWTIPDVLIPDGGWHFSYIGGIKRIQQKVAAMGHQEYNNEKFNTPEHIKMSILQGNDFLNQGRKFRVVDKKFLPKYVLNNEDKFKELLIENLPKQSLYIKTEIGLLEIMKKVRLIYRNLRTRYYHHTTK